MLRASWDALWVLLTAAVAGGIGGIGYELLQVRQENAGTVERPGGLGGRVLDLGWYASVILGAIAAMAFLYVFPPTERTTVVAAGGAASTVIEYDLIRVVPLSLIVGTSAGAFLNALQQKVLTVLNAQQTAATKAVAIAGLEGVQAVATQEAEAATAAALRTRLDEAVKQLQSVGADKPFDALGTAGRAVTDEDIEAAVAQIRADWGQLPLEVAQEVERRVATQVETAKHAVEVSASART